MPANPKVLVTSAGGKTGLQVAVQLLRKNVPVRAVLRTDDDRASRLRALGADVMIANLFDIADMRIAMSGVQRAYHCAPTAPNGLYYGSVFSIAAAEARLEHVVMLSQWLSASDHPSQFTREVWLNEGVLGLLPDTTRTIVNVGWFADNYFMVLEPAAQLGVLPLPLGDGNIRNNAAPSNEDIAAVVVGALLDPDKHAGKTYRPTGPELLSPNELAAAIGRALGRKVKYQAMSERMFLKALVALRPPNYSDAALTQLRHYVEDYRLGAFAVGGATSAVLDVAGREPESFQSIANRIVAERPEAKKGVFRKLKAMARFGKILMTPAPDPDLIELRKDYVRLSKPHYAANSVIWRESHGAGSSGNIVSLAG